jgi:hypothetical protein
MGGGLRRGCVLSRGVAFRVITRSGYGSGAGYGDGYGYGYGYGYGSGYGDGDGYGEKIGTVGSYDVLCVFPGYVRVGCEVHSVASWKEVWRDVARKHREYVTQEEVDALCEIVNTSS